MRVRLSSFGNINILDLVSRHTRMRYAAGTGGGEYEGACPFCVDDHNRNRFRVWPKGSGTTGVESAAAKGTPSSSCVTCTIAHFSKRLTI